MANAGMDLKSLQYLMGHSDAGVTMNVYTHASYDHAEQSMQKILQFQLPEKALKSGWHWDTTLTPNLHHLGEKLREFTPIYEIWTFSKSSDF